VTPKLLIAQQIALGPSKPISLGMTSEYYPCINSVPASRQTHCLSVTKANSLINIAWGRRAAYPGNDMEHTV